MPLEIADSHEPLDEKRIAALEMQIGYRLPKEYRAFLAAHNGGYANGSNAFRYKYERGPYTESRINELLGLTAEYGSLDKNYLRMAALGRIPEKLLPIADDPFGNLICISLAGKDCGAVYFWDHENEPDDGNQEFRNIHLIADSFDEFLSGLVPPEDLMEDS
jgi:cell wall assembly regulator SMI1